MSGHVDRTSADLAVSYRVKLRLDVARGRLSAVSDMLIDNVSGGPIDRLELWTLGPRLGTFELGEASVDGRPTTPRLERGMVIVPLGGVLPPGASTDVRLSMAIQARDRTTGDGWYLARAGEVLQASHWLPWVTERREIADPSFPFPDLTPFARSVEVDVATRDPALVALGQPSVGRETRPGSAATYRDADTWDLSIAASARYRVLRREVGGTTVRVFHLPGARATRAGRAIMTAAGRALPWIERRLGPVPRGSIDIAQVFSGTSAQSSPGMIWIPAGMAPSSALYYVTHELGHQWFGGLVGGDRALDPLASEGPAELLARLLTHTFRGSLCDDRLGRPAYAYTQDCFYETVYVRGASALDALRLRVGDAPFWGALRSYMATHRLEPGSTRDLLEAIDDTTLEDLRPIFERRFPGLYP